MLFLEMLHCHAVDDPYRFAESLDSHTIEYTAKQKERFSRKFGQTETEQMEIISEYVETKKVLQSLIKGEHILTLYSEGNEYHVSMDDHPLYSTSNVITWIEASSDCKRVALFETVGSDKGFLKLFTKGEQEKVIEDMISHLAFTEISYYTVKTFSETPPPDGGELNSHRVMHNGKIVFGTGFDSTQFIEMHPSGDRIILKVGDWNHSVIYTGDIENPETWQKVAESDYPIKVIGFVNNEICYLEKASMGRIKIGDNTIMEAERTLEDCVLVKDGILAFELLDAKSHPVLYDFNGELKQEFDFNGYMGLVYASSDRTNAIAVFSSFGVPYSRFVYRNGTFSKRDDNRALSLTVTEKWVDSSGTPIHYFLVSPRSGAQKKVLVNGYGGFGISWTPVFSPLFASLLNAGISIAYANLRGGGEYGEEWHRAGVLENKERVFSDMISVIRDLKNEEYRIVAMGQSNGGLLVGNILVKKPELLDGAVIGVPVLDMLRFHKLSVGKYWTTEYGDPDRKDHSDFLASYSPYHNVKDNEYPPALIYSRLKDDRVHPAHAVKFHMKLSEFTDKAYLRINSGGGHAGIPQKLRIQELCEEFNFILNCLQE